MILPGVVDIHTHDTHAPAGTAIVCIEPDRPGGIPAEPVGALYSTAVHPWRSAEAATLWPMVQQLAADPRIAAIGEAGLDRLKGAPMPEQLALLERHARLADDLGKPLIVHCVRAWAELLGLHRRLRPAQPWIIHGFRGGPALARQLLDAGMYISLGARFNPATATAVPADRLLLETDEGPAAAITTVARDVAAARNETST